MPSPRLLLVVGLLLLGAGGTMAVHNQYIESSGLVEPVSFEVPLDRTISFRPHHPRVHFVSLLVDARPSWAAHACVDSQGFVRSSFDLQWEVLDGASEPVAVGSLRESRMKIARPDHCATIFCGFWATPDQEYTLRLRATVPCEGLDALDPRIEIGLRPGEPLQGYFWSSYASMFLGLGCLGLFTRRKDRAWPYRPILRWIAMRRRARGA